jgi:hypothetical protein
MKPSNGIKKKISFRRLRIYHYRPIVYLFHIIVFLVVVTLCHNLNNYNLNIYRRGNLKSYIRI